MSQVLEGLSLTLVDLFLGNVKEYATKPAIQFLNDQLTYQQLYRQCRNFAAYLQAAGLKQGDRVALMLPNLPQYVIALYGSLMAGMTVVNINPMFKAQELEDLLNDSKPKIVVALDRATGQLSKALQNFHDNPPHIITTHVGDMIRPFYKRWLVNYKKGVKPSQFANTETQSFNQLLHQGKRSEWVKPQIDPDDLAFLQYTGGTTGQPKAAMLSHSNVRANVEQAYRWINPICDDGKETLLAVLPLFHIFSLVANALVAMRGGSLMILVADARDIEGIVGLMRQNPVSVLMGINTLFEALVKNSQFAQLNLPSLKLVIGGGMAVHETVAQKWHDIVGLPIHQGYGLTEASPIVCINPVHLPRFNTSIGLPVADTDIAVVDDNLELVEQGKVGELCVSGPQVMQGYWQCPEETANTLQNGWLYTGDMARIDDNGYVYIVDRKKDMVIVSGYNVYPQAIEQLMIQHDLIDEVAVVGEQHPKLGEVLKAYVVTHSDQITKADLINFCREHLVSYKVPRRIEFIDQLPKSNVGKVLKKQLKKPNRAS